MQRLFGTNGVRGISNETMTPELALRLGRAIGTFVQGDVVVATDTRTSGMMLKNCVIAGLLSTGCTVYDAGGAPSPALQYQVKRSDASAGVIITASHNPPEFNGIKVIDGDGTELSREKEVEIEELYFKELFYRAAWNEIGRLYEISILDLYVDGILSLFDTDRIRSQEYRVVLDCGNGAACYTMPYLLNEVTAVTTLNAQPDGSFPGRHSEPTEENLADLLATMTAADADLGIAYDGDADRAIFVDETGSYLSGDKSLALIAGHRADRNGGGTVVTPVSTSRCVEDYVAQHGGDIIYTRVGAPVVARRMLETDALFGGEGNGGLIFPEFQHCRDSGMASLAMLDLLASRGQTLSSLARELPAYAVYKTKIPCENRDIIEAIRDDIRADRIDETDGIKAHMPEGWVLVRPSGTEPIVRIYAEAETLEVARRLGEEFSQIVKNRMREGD
jgi:phosphomannomutase/phosphoglucomutase